MLIFRRLCPPLLLAAGFVASVGCERRPYGVDFSVDREFDFGRLRRVAILEPADTARASGLGPILAEAASDALGARFIVVVGNRLRTAVKTAQVEDAFTLLRSQLASGLEPDPALAARVARAIGVDALYATEIAGLERQVQPAYSYATVTTQGESGYGAVTQTHQATTVTTVRLTGRLLDGATGMVVWSGSKFHESGGSLESTGLAPIFRAVTEDFVLTFPQPGAAPAVKQAS